MGMDVDGAAILQAMARSPADFALNEGQLNALAMATLLNRLKDKAMTLAEIRSANKAIGSHDLGLALDSMIAKDLATLIKRLDPKHPELKSGNASWQRQQVRRLAEGTVEPAVVAARTIRALRPEPGAETAKKPPKTGEVMKSKALKPRTRRTALT